MKLGLYDAIILDVDSKDVSAGVSSPPQDFVQNEFLANAKVLLKDSGIIIIMHYNNIYALLSCIFACNVHACVYT